MTVTMVEHISDFELNIDIPYLTFLGKLWGVFCECLEKINHTITVHKVSSYSTSNNL